MQTPRLHINRVKDVRDLIDYRGNPPNVTRLRIDIDCRTGEMYVTHERRVGEGCSPAEWHGHITTLVSNIPLLRTAALNRLLSAVAPGARRALRGYDSVWNGHTYIAQFSADAEEAINDLRRTVGADTEGSLEGAEDEIGIWDAEDWFSTVVMEQQRAVRRWVASGRPLSEYIAREERYAWRHSVVVEGISSYLTALCDS